VKKKLVFCFPCKILGGVSNQFLRMAVHLQLSGLDVSLVDYLDGAMGSESKALGLNLIEYSDTEKASIPADALLIFQSMNPWTVFKNLSVPDDAELLFWTCHPDNLALSIPGLTKYLVSPKYGKAFYKIAFPLRYRRMQNFISSLDKKGSLSFIDAPCKLGIEELYDLEFEDNYIPVPISRVKGKLVKNGQNRGGVQQGNSCDEAINGKRRIVMGWVGRIADFKYPILRHTIGRLSSLLPSLDITIRFHIVGDGEFLEELKNYAKTIENIDFIFHGEVNQTKVQDMLRNDIRLAFAMGPAALEAASNSLPTVLLNFSFDEISFHRYSWLHHQQGFSVGAKMDNKNWSEDDGLKSILEDFLEKEAQLKVLAKNYVDKNHGVDSVCDRFLGKIAGARFLYSELKSQKISKPPLVYRAYKYLTG
jgi:glycosyltransferase involved in cell wall biosynthesis